MANTFEYAKLFQTNLDKLAVQTLRTGWMEANAGRVIYHGGDEIKIPKLSTDGLADYSRATGYVTGDVTVAYETRKLTQDRGRKFSIDAMDVDETAFIATASAVLGSFQTEKVVPEIDAYRITQLYQVAKDNGNSADYTLSKDDILAKIKTDIAKLRARGALNPVVHITYDALTVLELAMATQLRNVTWGADGVNTAVPSIDGCPLIPTASDRMYKELTINAAGGYTGEGEIHWVVVDSQVPIAVSKTEVPRIFSPEVNQNADAWIVTYRKFHDIWVQDNKQGLIIAAVASGSEGDGNVNGRGNGNITPSVSLTPHTASIAAGATKTIKVKTMPAGSTVTWASDATSYATVSNGTVTGVAAGEANITASITVDGTTYTDTCKVTVTSA